jgi:hypothetical protein
MTTTTREIVQAGVASYLGGTSFDQNSRSWRGATPAALSAVGLTVVRTHQSKRVNDNDFVLGQAAGRGMGSYVTVEARQTTNVRYCIPAGSGRRKLTYRITLHVYHLAHKAYAEDAESDVNGICEAINDYLQLDPSLGGICYQAGESRFGIRTDVPPSELTAAEITTTHAQIQFEVQVMIVA